MNFPDLQNILIQALNIVLMCSVGLDLNGAELRASLVRWRVLSLAFVLNFLIVPLVAWGLVDMFSSLHAVSFGLLLAVFCPGGGTGLLLSRTAKGNMELSVVLLVLCTVGSVFVTPMWTQTIASSLQGEGFSWRPVLWTLLIFQCAPLLIGGLIRSRSVVWAERLNRVLRPISTALFVILVLGLLVTRGHLVVSVGWSGALLIFVVVSVSLLLPTWATVSWPDRAALSTMTATRNLSLALLLSSQFFTDQTTVTVLTYGLIMYVFSVLWVFVLRRCSVRDEPPV